METYVFVKHVFVWQTDGRFDNQMPRADLSGSGLKKQHATALYTEATNWISSINQEQKQRKNVKSPVCKGKIVYVLSFCPAFITSGITLGWAIVNLWENYKR